MSPSHRWGGGSFPKSKPRRPGSGQWRAAGKRPFGTTWWGQAWVEALEQRARLDPNRLPRGRTYARTGAVDELQLSVGEVRAAVQGSRAKPYSVHVRVRVWSDAEWDRVLDAMAAQIGHTAALLDGELPPEVADDARSVGLDLLPGPGEVQPRCSCPDWADPCKHAAAVCYLVADQLDVDPFAVLLLRGRGRDELLAALRSRRVTAGGGVAAPAAGVATDSGVPARAAWAAWASRTAAADPVRGAGEPAGGPAARPVPLDLPALPVPPAQPGRPTVLGTDPPAEAGIDPGALRRLAADAAGRALQMALGAASSALELDAAADLARRAAGSLPGGAPGAGHVGLDDLARRAGVPVRDLVGRALAWGQGGVAALEVLDGQWDAGPEALRRGRALLGAGAVGRRNRVTLGSRQLRLGHDLRWYPYRKNGTGWDPDGPPLDDEGGPSDGVGAPAADAGPDGAGSGGPEEADD